MTPGPLTRARSTCVATVDGVEVFVVEGEVRPADDPLVRARPGLFESDDPEEKAQAPTKAKRWWLPWA